MSATHARDTMSASNDLAWRRPFLSLISRGRCFRPAVRPSHLSNAPFASISAPSQPTDGDDIRRGDTSTSAASCNYSSPRVSSSHDSPGEERFTSLVHLESEPLITVIFPQWMVEVYQEFVMFGSACKRLFLPENSIKSKLPYYRCGNRPRPNISHFRLALKLMRMFTCIDIVEFADPGQS